MLSLRFLLVYIGPGGGGGGHHIEGDGDVPLDRVCGFAVITISTGYLNQPKSASPLEQGI